MNLKKLIKVVIFTFFLSALSSTGLFAITTGFNDIDSNHYQISDKAREAISELYGFGIIAGDSLDNFDPKSNIKKIDAIDILINALGNKKYQSILSHSGNLKSVFNDMVQQDNSKISDANIANEKGIINGIYNEDGTYSIDPEANLTVGDLSSIIVKALGYNDADLGKENGDFKYISKAYDLGIFNDAEVPVDSDSPVTRSDMAVMIDAMLHTPTKAQQKKYDETGITLKAGEGTEPPNLLSEVKSRFNIIYVDGTYDSDSKTSKSVVTDAFTVDRSMKPHTVKITDTTNYASSIYTIAPYLEKNFAENYLGKAISFYAKKLQNNEYRIYNITYVNGKSITFSPSMVGKGKSYSFTNSSLNYTDLNNYAQKINYDLNNEGLGNFYYNGDNPKADISTVMNQDTINTLEDMKIIFSNYDGTDTYTTAFETADNLYIVSEQPKFDEPLNQKSLSYSKYIGAGNESAGNVYLVDCNGVPSNISVTGDAKKLRDIQINDAIYVSSSADNKYTDIQDVRKIISGNVTGTQCDGSGVTNSITVGKDNYLIDKLVPVPSLNTVHTYVLDKTGTTLLKDITANPSFESQTGGIYGYLVGAAKSYDWGSYNVCVRIMPLASNKPQDVTYYTYSSNMASVSDITYMDNMVKAFNDRAGQLIYYYPSSSQTENAKPQFTYGYVNDTFGVAPDINSAVGNRSFHFNPVCVVGDTVIYNDQDKTFHKSSEYDWSHLPSTVKIVTGAPKSQNASAFGDYYVLEVNGNPAAVKTNYGVITAFSGMQYINDVVYYVYSALIGGVKQDILTTKPNLFSPLTGNVFLNNGNDVYQTVSNAVYSAFSGLISDGINNYSAYGADIRRGYVEAIDSTRLLIRGYGGDKQIYFMDPDVKIYDINGYKELKASDIPLCDTNNVGSPIAYVCDNTKQDNILMIFINNE